MYLVAWLHEPSEGDQNMDKIYIPEKCHKNVACTFGARG